MTFLKRWPGSSFKELLVNRVNLIKRLASLSIVFILLGGCDTLLNLQPPTQTPGASSVGTPTLELPVTTPINTPAPAQSVNPSVISIWVPPQFDPSADNEAAQLLRAQIESFQNQHPEIQIEVRVKAVSGPGGLLDSLSNGSAAAPSVLPALIALPRGDLETAALKGLIFPWNGITDVLNDGDWYPYAIQLGTVQGSNYGLPFAGDALAMLYYPLKVSYAPDRWQDYVARGYAVAFPAADPHALVISQMILSSIPPAETEPGQEVLSEATLKKSLLLVSEGSTSGAFPYWLGSYENFDQTLTTFKEQQANYAVVWASSVISQMPANGELANLPSAGNDPYTLANGWVWCISDPLPERHEMDAALVNHLVEPTFLAEWTEASHMLPTRASSLALWSDQSLTKILNDLALSARLIPSNTFLATTSPVLEEVSLNLIRGQITYQQAIDTVIKELK